MMVVLNLVVIRSGNLEESVKFYQMLGLNFEKHQDGNGLAHFAGRIGKTTFEIYPQTAYFRIYTPFLFCYEMYAFALRSFCSCSCDLSRQVLQILAFQISPKAIGRRT